MPALFHNIFKNIARAFRGRNLLWHLLAIALTVAIVMSGLDWSYYLATRQELIMALAFPAVILGGLLPFIVPLAMLVVGEMRKKSRLIAAAWASWQAALLGWLISTFYKSLTGRIPPTHSGSFSGVQHLPGSLVDTSHGFQFGFLKGGVFWGWPSSHTTVAFAMAVCLIMLYPKNKALALGALLYALYVGLSVSVTIHWLSEFVAGAVIGSVIGVVVGRSFRELEQPSRAPGTSRQ